VRADEASYELLQGDSLEITHHGERVTVEPGRVVRRRVPPAPSWPEPTQPQGRAPRRRRSVRR
jgi:alpha,alpha-trehalose phosphorylase